LKVSFFIFTSVLPPNNKYAPNNTETTCPITVAIAAPSIPQFKTATNIASNTILVIAPIAFPL
jgi:hypothetical protein